MFAVAHRAYPVATVLFHAAFNITMDGKSQEKDVNVIIDDVSAEDGFKSWLKTDRDLLLSMIYPPESNWNDNPIYMLCCNDTCSFTWTGANYIN